MLALALVLASSGVSSGQDNTRFRIVRGKADTVYTEKHYVVGVAKPGSEVTINGKIVKQYSTGGFGTMLNLAKGDNSISIKAVTDGKELTDNFSVFLKDREVVASENRAVRPVTGPVISTLKGAYLNSSAGTDRLGGAKINYLAENIRMELLDSLNNLYKVKLSDNRYSYIPKHLVKREATGVVPFSITSSVSVHSTGSADIVGIALEGRHPYIVYRELTPNRIVVDIHGAQNNSNWLTHSLDLKMVDYVECRQSGSDVFSVIIYLKEKYSWGYSIDYSGNSMIIRVKHAPAPEFKGLVIGLDAGHGGSANGAISITGAKEKELNLEMANILKAELERRGAKVIMARSDDKDVSMQDRIDFYRAGRADMVLSIHCNAGGSPLEPMGASTYYRHIEYRELAKKILSRMLELQGVKNFGLVGNFNFSLSSHSDIPVVLVETMFLSSLPDEEKILDPEFRRDMMLKVVKGVEDYLNEIRR